MKRGLFISLEGGEGAGKTSAMAAVISLLEAWGCNVVSTREPGGIPIAEQIRSLILDKNNTMMDGRTEALLYAAARRQHLVEKVIPALLAGTSVVCDRYLDSSLAYQGVARGLGIEEVLSINHFAIEGWMPDLTFFLDVRPEVGLRRIQSDQSREVNRLDLEAIDFHDKVRQGYFEVVRLFPERVFRIDAEQSKEQVQKEICDIMNQKLFHRV